MSDICAKLSRLSAVVFLSVQMTAVSAHSDDLTPEAQGGNYATTENTAEAYDLFLSNFPQSDFADIAKARLAELEDSQPKDTENTLHVAGVVSFDRPLQLGAPEILGPPEILGKTSTEILMLIPSFAPIDGIPEGLWKDQQSTSCHQWTRDDLCAQGKNYITSAPSQRPDKQHPFGGSLKINLRNWAQNDCM